MNNKIELKEFDEVNLEKTFEWMSDVDIKKPFLFSTTITKASHLVWFDNYKKDASQKIYAIYAENVYCGNVGLKNLTDKSTEMWIYIGEKSMWGKRIGYFSVLELVNLLTEMKLESVYLNVAAFNDRAMNLYKKIGFVHTDTTEKEFAAAPVTIYKMEKTL